MTLLLVVIACGDPNRSTEIGNPAFTMRLHSSTPTWIGADPSAVLRIDRAWVSIETASLSRCDGGATVSVGSWFDLLEPTQQEWDAPLAWCGLALTTAPRPAPEALDDVEGTFSAHFRGVDSFGRRFEITDRFGHVISMTSPRALYTEGRYVVLLDAAVWLDALDIGSFDADLDGVVRIDGAITAGEGSGSLWADVDENGRVDNGDVEVVPALDRVVDADGDGLQDVLERQLGTDPERTDTDADGLDDGVEVLLLGTLPTNADTDADGVGDGVEVANGTDPRDPDSPGRVDADGDGFDDRVDCDDSDATVFPGAPDPLGDQIDQDCDGVDG